MDNACISYLTTYNDKLVHSTTSRTPKEASKQDREVNPHADLNLEEYTRRYPAWAVGDKFHIYTKRWPLAKAHVSIVVRYNFQGRGISHAPGLTFYNTTPRARPFLRHVFEKSTSNVSMIPIVTASNYLHCVCIFRYTSCKIAEAQMRPQRPLVYCHTTPPDNQWLAILLPFKL